MELFFFQYFFNLTEIPFQDITLFNKIDIFLSCSHIWQDEGTEQNCH